MKAYILITASALFAAGCATTKGLEYQAQSPESAYGYAETLKDDGTYIVEVALPANAEKSMAFSFFDRRAAELCGEGDYEKNIYKARRPTINAPGQYVHGGVGVGGGRAGGFLLEGTLTCTGETRPVQPEPMMDADITPMSDS